MPMGSGSGAQGGGSVARMLAGSWRWESVIGGATSAPCAGPLVCVVPSLSTLLAALAALWLACCQGAGGLLPATTARIRPIPRGLAPLIGVVLLLLSPGAPAAAAGAGAPIRWNTGGAVWSTSQDGFDTVLRNGEVTDRGLAAGLANSGWPVDQLRAALAKS